MAEETLDTLELVIQTQATDAKEKVESLAASVSSFGESVSAQMGNLGKFADEVGKITKALENLSKIKGARAAIESVTSAASMPKGRVTGAVDQAAQSAAKAKAWLIKNPGQEVKPRTRYAQWSDGTTRKFNQSSANIARQVNQEYEGTGMSNKEIAARISAIRAQIVAGQNEDVFTEIRKLAEEVTAGAGKKRQNSTIQAMNDVFQGGAKGRFVGVDEKDIAAIGGIRSANDLLKANGIDFQFAKWPSRYSPKSAVTHSADEFENLGMHSAEDIVDRVSQVANRYNAHKEFLDENFVKSDAELLPQVFGRLVDQIYDSTPVENENVKGRQAILDAQETALQQAAAERTAEEGPSKTDWAVFKRMESEMDRDYKADHKLNWKEVEFNQQKYAEQQAGPDNTADEIAAWKAEEDALNSVATAAHEAAAAVSELNTANEQGAGPAERRAGVVLPFEAYQGKDWRKENAEDTEYFDRRLGEIVSEEGALENLRENVKNLGKGGALKSRVPPPPPAPQVEEAKEQPKPEELPKPEEPVKPPVIPKSTDSIEARGGMSREKWNEFQASLERRTEAQEQERQLENLKMRLRENTPERIKRLRDSFNGDDEKFREFTNNSIPKTADEGLAAGLIDEKTAQAMKEAAGEVSEVSMRAKEAKANVDALMESLNRPVGKMNWSQGIDRMMGIDTPGKSAKDSASAFMQEMQADNPTAQLVRDLNPELQEMNQQAMDSGTGAKELTSDLVGLDGELKKKKGDAKEASKALQEVGDAAEESGKKHLTLKNVLAATFSKQGFSALTETLAGTKWGKIGQKLFNVAKMRAYRAVVMAVGKGLKEGINNLYQWSKASHGAFATSMDTAASKLMLMKNSFAAALAPAINMVLPLLSQVASVVNQVSNAIAQFLARLTGQTSWTKAVETAEEWGAATASGAKKADKKVKDLLADWDELNIIQSDTGNSSGGGGRKSKTDYSKMFEETSVFDDWMKYFDQIKTVVDIIGIGIKAWFGVELLENFLTKLGFAEDEVSRFTGRLKKGIVGAVMLGISFSLADDIGADIAENGFNWTNALAAVGDVLAAGVGGYLLAESIVPGSGVIGTIAGVTIALAIGIDGYLTRKRGLTYGAMARRAFAATGRGGIDIETYKASVQAELDRRFGTLTVTVDAFEPYKEAADKMSAATTAISNLHEQVAGGRALTKEEAEQFKENWNIVFESMNQMHNATWDTINFGIADAMRDENGAAREELEELRRTMIELAGLTGGIQGEWRAEMGQITSRIRTGTATEEDLKRYEQLSSLIAQSDVSESVRSMREWESVVQGFDFGSGPEAVENATKFIGDMDETYTKAIQSVKDWEKTQADAISAARAEIEMDLQDPELDPEKRSRLEAGKTALDQWEERYKAKVAADLADIDRMKAETYGKIWNQVLFGAALNGWEGIDEYFKQVNPVIEDLKKAGYKTEEWKGNGLFSMLGMQGVEDWTEERFEWVFRGSEARKEWWFNALIPSLRDQLSEENYDKLITEMYKRAPDSVGDLVDYDLVPGDFYTSLQHQDDSQIRANYHPLQSNLAHSQIGFNDARAAISQYLQYLVDSGTTTLGSRTYTHAHAGTAATILEAPPEAPVKIDADTVEMAGRYIDEDTEELHQADLEEPVPSAGTTAEMRAEKDGDVVRIIYEASEADVPEVSGLPDGYVMQDGKMALIPDEVAIDADTVDMTGGYVDEDTEELHQADLEEPAPSAGANTSWYSAPDESFEIDASANGQAADEDMTRFMEGNAAGLAMLQSITGSIQSIMSRLEGYAQTIANKDTTVVIGASTALGGVASKAAQMLSRASGTME